MGGFIKVTLREENKTTTNILYTSSLNDLLADYQNIFDNDISSLITKNAVNKDTELTKECHPEISILTPFDYGYIFIDRIKRKVFFLNDYNAISHFSNFQFKEEEYLQLKEQNFKMKIQRNYDSNSNTFKDTELIDLKKDFISTDYIGYRKLNSAVPYLEEVISIDDKITDISSLESILDELTKLRKQRKIFKLKALAKKNLNTNVFLNDLIITKFKDWDFIEDNKSKNRYEELFSYLLSEKLLSDNEITIWEKEISEISD